MSRERNFLNMSSEFVPLRVVKSTVSNFSTVVVVENNYYNNNSSAHRISRMMSHQNINNNNSHSNSNSKSNSNTHQDHHHHRLESSGHVHDSARASARHHDAIVGTSPKPTSGSGGRLSAGSRNNLSGVRAGSVVVSKIQHENHDKKHQKQ